MSDFEDYIYIEILGALQTDTTQLHAWTTDYKTTFIV